MDTLILKYGPLPNKSSLGRGRNESEIPSYKRDAMNMIVNRIYRYMGKILEEL